MTAQWHSWPINVPTLGSVVHVATPTSRRKAVVIASKPEAVLVLRYSKAVPRDRKK
jgi:hypothetical protein